MLAVTLIFLLIVSILKYFEEKVCLACYDEDHKIISFIVGATVVSLFVELLNDIYLRIHDTHSLIVLLLPFAFIMLMLVERHIREHIDDYKKGSELQVLMKTLSFFAGILIRMVAAFYPQENMFEAVIFLGILTSYHFISAISVHFIHEKQSKDGKESFFGRILLVLSPFYGFAAVYFLNPSEIVNVSILTFFGCALIYVIIKEVLPKGKGTKISYFLAGAALLAAVFITDIFI